MTDHRKPDNRRHRQEDMTPEEWAAHCERMKARYAAAASNLMMFLEDAGDDRPTFSKPRRPKPHPLE